MNIVISPRSQKLIRKYLLASGVHQDELPSIASSIDLATLIYWLNQEQLNHSHRTKEEQQRIEFIFVSLRTELLHDLFVSMSGDGIKLPKEDESESVADKIQFGLLTAAGILVAACQGFDGIVTMLSIFEVSTSVILGAGFIFSFLSVVVFCGFDLVKVSNALGVKLGEAYKLLDAYVLQLQMIKLIREKVDDYDFADPQCDLQELKQIISMLQICFTSLTEASKQFEQALNNENMQLAKALISGASAILFFGGGFFAGQSVAMIISGLFVSSMVPAFWPVIIFSSLVGIAALSVYWCVERPGLNKLVSSWFGLNEENVQKLCDKDLISKETKNLDNLEKKIISASRLADRLARLEHRVGVDEQMVHDDPVPQRTAMATRASANYYSFLKPDSLTSIAVKGENLDEGRCFCI
ncbi:coiled-coil protein [Legionella steelei]|uniref:Coiled-coil protein n=1 Tax=Legionella steelei TaxID=947033 RepID=A0A0W0ZKI8_9GAMM|nr:hypothetical protein [Legionella steelei]KTD69693.1 coiled-coil protein [Legionella steelei]